MVARSAQFVTVTSLVIATSNAVTTEHVAPIPQKPAGASGPGRWPNVLTGALFSFDYKAHSFDFDQNNVTIFIENQGPLYWSMPRANIGDFAPRLCPKYPFSQDTLKDVQLIRDGGIQEISPSSASTQAWRPSHRFGLMIPTIRQNGLKWDDSNEVFYGTIGVCCCCSKGYGYSMLDGQYGYNEPHYNIDVLIGQAGTRGEGVVNFGVAWFPFEEGWIGGWLDVPAVSEGTGDDGQVVARWRGDSHSSQLPDDLRGIVTWSGMMGEAVITLPDVDSATDGMLFVVASDDEDDLNVAIASPGNRAGKGWLVQLRSDVDLSMASSFTAAAQSDFAFLYVPFDTPGLIGGTVDGYSGDLQDTAKGLVRVERVSPGRYSISIMHKGVSDGMLILQPSGWTPDGRNTKPVFMSYEPKEEAHQAVFIVEARHVSKINGKDDFPLIDTDFAFVWVDFHFPMGPLFIETLRDTCWTGAGTRAMKYWRRRHITFFTGFVVGGLIMGLLWLHKSKPGWFRAQWERLKGMIQGRVIRPVELSIGREDSIVTRGGEGFNDDWDRFARANGVNIEQYDDDDDEDEELFDEESNRHDAASAGPGLRKR